MNKNEIIKKLAQKGLSPDSIRMTLLQDGEVAIVYVFGGDVESLLGVFDDEHLMIQAMHDNLAKWNLDQNETIGQALELEAEDENGLRRIVYPVMLTDDEEDHTGPCYSVERHTLNKAREF